MKLDFQDPVIVNTRHQCAVCAGQALDLVMDLPKLPLTGRFTKDPAHDVVDDGIDQKLLFCPQCGHGQLAFQVNPKTLYNEQYHFRTSRSKTACRGITFFLDTIFSLMPSRLFDCVLDIGCNDLYMLEQLKNKTTHRFGIDPLWQGKECEPLRQGITVIGQEIEDVNLQTHLKIKPDLILCRHTLEHILEPHLVFEKVLSVAREGAVIAIEVPSLNGLVDRLRFDQVFHQHLQYFSKGSLYTLMTSLGVEYVGYRENYHDWGAVCMVFIKRSTGKGQKHKAPTEGAIKLSILSQRYDLFRQQMEQAAATLAQFKGAELFGYGAAQMLPILAYHMGEDLSALNGVLDDDMSLQGSHYWNLPLRIKDPADVNCWDKTNIFLTAVDNVQPILERLFTHRPRHIIYPLHII